MPADSCRPRLLALAAEGMVPVLAGCAGALAGGPEGGVVGGVVGVAVGQSVEKAINFFGRRIVERWAAWFREQPPAERDRALTELAATPPEEARRQAEELLDRLALEPLASDDRELAVNYLTLLPGSIDRALSRPSPSGVRGLPPTVSAEEPQQLLSLLPLTLPPYPVGVEVPGTPYRLEALLGSGGFGAVYRASTRSLQHLPLAIKFCLDPTLARALHRERENLERLMKAGGEDWSPRVVRLYGYDLEHETPYLVYEFVTGGDLIRHLGQRHEKMGRPLDAQEVFALITQVVEALAFAHDNGLVHRDLKPANVLVESGVVKLADFGLGGVTAARAAQVSRIGATTVDTLSVADQASLFRGAGTPLYMSPEQRRGQPPDPRHDLYSLGVMWYQLLIGDVSRELHPGWAKELALRFHAPPAHVNLIDACVGWFDERPKNAGELLRMLREPHEEAAVVATKSDSVPPPFPPPAPLSAVPVAPADEMRQSLLVNTMTDLLAAHRTVSSLKDGQKAILVPGAVAAGVTFLFTSTERLPFGATLALALLAGGVVAGLSALVRLGRQKEARERLATAIALLEREFPAIVAGWGGITVLHDRALVEQIARKMGIEVDPPAPEAKPAPAPAGGPTTLDSIRHSAAVEQVRELRQEQVRLAGFARRRPLPAPLAAFLGLLLGAGVGVGVGFYADAVMSPQTWTGRGGTVEYRKFNGISLSASGFIQETRNALLIGGLSGAGVGLLVAVAVGVLLARRGWYRWQLLGGLMLGAVVGGPAGTGLGVLYHYHQSPFMTASPNRGEQEFYLASGVSVDEPTYGRAKQVATANALFLGFGSGVAVALAGMLAFQLWYGRRARAAEVAVEDQARRVAGAFPELAALGGGVEGLSRPGSARQLLLGLGEKVDGSGP